MALAVKAITNALRQDIAPTRQDRRKKIFFLVVLDRRYKMFCQCIETGHCHDSNRGRGRRRFTSSTPCLSSSTNASQGSLPLEAFGHVIAGVLHDTNLERRRPETTRGKRRLRPQFGPIRLHRP